MSGKTPSPMPPKGPQRPRRREEGPEAVGRALAAGVPMTAVLLPKAPLNAQLSALHERAVARGVPIWWASEGDLRRMSADFDAPAQTLACLGAPLTGDLETLLARGGAVWLMHRPAYASNVGYAIRTAEVSGAEALIVDGPGFNHADRSRASHVSMGADRLLPVLYATTAEVLHAARLRGHRIVALEDAGTKAPWEVVLTGPIVLLAGGEREGLDAETLDMADDVVRIPMPGFVPSYNLQAALAAVASERLRQQAAAEVGEP